MKINKGIFVWFLLPNILHCQFVSVDTSGNLPPEEIEYINKRDRRTCAALTRILKLDKEAQGDVRLPRIAFAGSGGGFRATTSYVAMLAALQYTGVFDCATYAAGISGGAWALFPMILRGLDPISYSTILKQRLCQNYAGERENILLKLVQKFGENFRYAGEGNFNFVDAWGAIISERLFGDVSQGHCITFDAIRDVLSRSDSFPYPVCPVIISQTHPDYELLEINPFEIYSHCLGGSIPNSVFGHYFEAGASVVNKPPLSLEFYMGLVGSAFCLSVGDVLFNGMRDLFDAVQLDKVLPMVGADLFVKFTYSISDILDHAGLYKTRLFPSKIPNYSYHMAGSKLKDLQFLELIDAGANINLPIPTLLRRDRNIDIFIICDSSSDAPDRDFTELRYAADWARTNGVKFPSLIRFKKVTPDMKIFYEDDLTVPFVIYFSNRVNIATTTLVYTPDEFDKLFGSMYKLVSNGSAAIIDSIKKKSSVPNNFDALPQSPKASIFNYCNIL